MYKAFIAIVFLVNMSIPMLYAEMTRTEACKKNIEVYESRVSDLQQKIDAKQKMITETDKKLAKAREFIDDFSNLPFVPQFLIDWKTNSQKEAVSKLSKEFEVLTSELDQYTKELETAKESLQAEKNKLGPIKNIVITYIKIKAKGDWDTDKTLPKNEPPDIRIKMGNHRTGTTSGRVAKDEDTSYSFEYKKEISTGDLNAWDHLIVYDVDDDDDEEDMGTIDLKKNSIEPKAGVSGDSKILPELTGSSSSQKGKIDYTIIYKVYF